MPALPGASVLAIYHLRSGTDETRIPLPAARIGDAFLDHDTAFKCWRAEHAATLPTALPPRSPRQANDHA